MAYTTIDKPDTYFNTVLYTGNGGSQSITGVNFRPDWIWIKNRDAGNDHNSYDSIRGATKDLNNNTTNAESTIAEGLKSFDSNGFTVGTNSAHNGSGENFVSWNWLASNTTASNTDGSITSTVSVNTTSGFSIVSYAGNSTSGATIGHSLGTTPSMIIVKSRTSAYNWAVYHSSVGATKYLRLNDTLASTTSSARWNDTAPTSSFFTLGNAVEVNETGGNYIAYCFAEKKGFSKFGSYTGNGNSNGTFVYLGFKPAWIMIKRTDVARDWLIHDLLLH